MYFLQKNNGILSCLDPATGKPHYDQQRLEDITGVYSSPVGAADRVYIAGRNGATQVIKRGKSFETIAVNKLDDEFTASPAIVGNELFLRGHKRLYCIAAQ
jgi:outer membrane protein assembly factor BamB